MKGKLARRVLVDGIVSTASKNSMLAGWHSLNLRTMQVRARWAPQTQGYFGGTVGEAIALPSLRLHASFRFAVAGSDQKG